MALPATAVFQVQSDGSDSICGGGYDYATTGKPTDLTATSATGTAPQLSSASYTFVAGDVGAWVVISAGTNWRTGRYQITSITAGKANIEATSGQYYLVDGNGPTGRGFADGCATAASPTGGTWSIDYSEQAAAQFARTDLTRVTNSTITSASAPFEVAQVGNILRITAGTNWTVGFYHITAVNSGTKVATTDRTCCAVGAGSGTGYEGGALASYGQFGAIYVAGMDCFIKTGSYTHTSASANVSGGYFNTASAATANNPCQIVGYDTGMTRYAGSHPSSRPVVTLNLNLGGTGMINFASGGNFGLVANIEFNLNSKTTALGVNLAATYGLCQFCKFSNGTTANWAVSATVISDVVIECEATGGSAVPFGTSGTWLNCVAHDNTASGWNITATAGRITLMNCIADTNTGATSDGFSCNTASVFVMFVNCIAYANGRHGFNVRSDTSALIVNCAAQDNADTGFACGDSTTNKAGVSFFARNAAFSNDVADWYNANYPRWSITGFGESWSTILTASPFVDAAGRDWRLSIRNGAAGSLGVLNGWPLYPADQFWTLEFSGSNVGFARRMEPALCAPVNIGFDRGSVNG